MTEVIIRLLDLPYNTKAFTAVDGNGDYNLYINARYSHETQRIAHDHEMTHISQDHFHRDSDVIQDELEAENLEPISTQPQPKPQSEYPVYSPQPVAKMQQPPPDILDKYR